MNHHFPHRRRRWLSSTRPSRSSSLTQCKPCRYFRVSVRQFGWLLHALAPRLPMERSSDPSFDATSLTCQHHFGWFVQPLAFSPQHNNSCFFCSVEICCRCKRLYWFNGVFKIKKLFTSQIHSRCVRTLTVSVWICNCCWHNSGELCIESPVRAAGREQQRRCDFPTLQFRWGSLVRRAQTDDRQPACCHQSVCSHTLSHFRKQNTPLWDSL